MKIDITRDLDAHTPVYEGDPGFQMLRVKTVLHHGVQVEKLSLGSHSGTHIDAPAHFIKNGATTRDIPLETLMGTCIVTAGLQRFLDSDIPAERVLFKGDVRLDENQAVRLAGKDVKLVGVETLSIGNGGVHRLLLEKNMIIIEALQLSGVKPGTYTLFCLPLKINAGGAPARAVLVQ